ncbi:Alpha/Beta hydrolase protein [Zychaea mexicana]|uniref:Alpha/Beta hydrolase protein n=1 Tax=Zychaea mexicana TaxID=64656 RepID=UPI0022FEFB74|nr:Alpha/Beta hydrolase protein [Zychaea mexicana]KAI9495065.1 Alpha/Beta hydrolase protein [Zychaea mexicana]
MRLRHSIHSLSFVISLLLLLCQQFCEGVKLKQQQSPFHVFPSPTQSLQLKAIYHRPPESRTVWRQEVVYTTTASSIPNFPVSPVLRLISRPRNTNQQLRDLYNQGRLMRLSAADMTEFESSWGLVPDVSHRPSILALAMMTNNAYTSLNKTDSTDWYPLGPPWNVNSTFGWDDDGIRGHVFGNEDDSLLVISIKGTSAGLWTGGSTGERDKQNDNMLFSCCCGRVSRVWQPVCECYVGNDYKCESHCLEKALLEHELYYDHALEIYKEVADRYRYATIWLTGHSLGGALASMVGATFGVPTVTFESPGDQLASSRLHLPHPPGAANMPMWHFGHTADPIFVGVCTGPWSSCWYGGFALETRCHTGKVCSWDTVNEHGWRVDIRSHRIGDVIEKILKRPDQFPTMPDCKPEPDECSDCQLWDFYDERDSLLY